MAKATIGMRYTYLLRRSHWWI